MGWGGEITKAEMANKEKKYLARYLQKQFAWLKMRAPRHTKPFM